MNERYVELLRAVIDCVTVPQTHYVMEFHHDAEAMEAFSMLRTIVMPLRDQATPRRLNGQVIFANQSILQFHTVTNDLDTDDEG